MDKEVGICQPNQIDYGLLSNQTDHNKPISVRPKFGKPAVTIVQNISQ